MLICELIAVMSSHVKLQRGAAIFFFPLPHPLSIRDTIMSVSQPPRSLHSQQEKKKGKKKNTPTN